MLMRYLRGRDSELTDLDAAFILKMIGDLRVMGRFGAPLTWVSSEVASDLRGYQ